MARAQERLPGFSSADVAPHAVAELCRRLDALPLAIELIAGWVGTLSIHEILAQQEMLLDEPLEQGIANRYFGGGTHHFGVLSGPGKVWLQSMTMLVLAASLAPYLGAAGGRGKAVEGGVIGGVIGDLLR